MKLLGAFSAAAVVCLLGLLSACAPAPAPTPSAALTPVSLKVVNLAFIALAPFWIAQDQGYFKEQALDITLVDISQTESIAAVASGQVDVTSGQLSSGMFNTIARGGNMKLVADKGFIDPNGCDNYGVLARAGFGDPATLKPADYKGKTLVLTSATWMEYYLDKLFATVNVNAHDLEFVSMQPASQIDALNAKKVDLIAQNEPWVTRLREAGGTPFLTPVSKLMPNSQFAVTIFGPKLLGENAEVGKRFMVAYLKAVRKYNEGKIDSNVKTIAKATQLDEALLKRMCWPALRADGALNVESVIDFEMWAVGRKQSDKVLTAEQMYDPTFVQYANTVLGPASK